MINAKESVKLALLKSMLPAMERSGDCIDSFLAKAAQVYDGGIDQQALLQLLQGFYQDLDLDMLKRSLDYEQQRDQIIASGYKLDLLSYPRPGPLLWETLGVWSKRLALLRSLGIRLDWLMLRGGQTIPPHAHRGVLSGFKVVEGTVAIRHYDVAEYRSDSVMVERTVDRDLGAGDFTVNAEHRDNIHWLQGLAELSILFRFNATQLKSQLPDMLDSNGRLYVDVGAAAEPQEGCFEAPLANRQRVSELRIR